MTIYINRGPFLHKAAALPSGVVKAKTCESTDQTTYDNWYNSVYVPSDPAGNNSTGNRNANTRSGNTASATAE
ncbi:hypothetical protein [Ruminococcus flavefaciens]|uniref:hypothetical protein n=1 Tax=Ruminococcus flavefaciens TaxID=1265 RepID=UPI0026F157F8|nr:hypothetical protein [Ruminococcus flavefaciens]